MSKVRIKTLTDGASAADAGFVPIDTTSVDGELRKYSITPTTLESREYDTSINDIVFTESFQNPAGIKVLRFGINVNAIEVSSSGGGSGGAASAAASEAKSRSSGKSDKSDFVFTQGTVDTINHLPAEISAFVMALDYLSSSGSTVAVIDILAREKGELKILPSGKYESHAVLLYRDAATNNIFVIDPNNSKYSWHIANEEFKSIATSKGFAGIVPYEKIIQIYTHKGDTGPATTEYRDCIDIAVKLGFGLVTFGAPFSIAELRTNPVIVALSNTDLDPTLPNVTAPMRVKQNSDFNVVSAFKVLEVKIFHDIKVLRSITNHAMQRVDFYDTIITDARSFGIDTSHLAAVKLTKGSVIDKYKRIFDYKTTAALRIDEILSRSHDVAIIGELVEFEAHLTGSIIELYTNIDL